MQNTQAATSVQLDKPAIETAASGAGMTVSEFMEWGFYSIVQTYTESEYEPHEVKKELRNLRERFGSIPHAMIGNSQIDTFCAATGLSIKESAELALLSAFDHMNSSEFPHKTPREMLLDDREEYGAFVPNIITPVHPFMERLFSRDLKAVHGPTFGEIGGDHVLCEHLFLDKLLQQAFAQQDWDEAIVHLMGIEDLIKHHPGLQNEAAAIRGLLEAERVLGDFCRAVNAD